jgi:hypothetical protein
MLEKWGMDRLNRVRELDTDRISASIQVVPLAWVVAHS